MKIVTCNGTPFEIGFQHGQQAKNEIDGSIAFYKELFQESATLSWDEVLRAAERFEPFVGEKLPDYLEEMNGIAQGSSHPLLSILALNVRTEIAFGLSTDGCTALSHTSSRSTILAQNWDWQTAQKPNLIRLRISQRPKPSIDMISEAGIIGKIGLNSAGVGVCLNAILAKGVAWQNVPCHLALRLCLDSISREEAVGKVTEMGVASACHMLVADGAGATGLECSYRDVITLAMSDAGVVIHTNHFVEIHPGVEDPLQWRDSKPRLARAEQLLGGLDTDGAEEGIAKILEDEEGYPMSICREEIGDSTVATLFSIVMDLGRRRAKVRMGRPCAVEEVVELDPCGGLMGK